MKQKALGWLAIGLVAGGVLATGYFLLKENPMNQANTMEIVIYKTKSGVTPEAHRTRALGVEKIMRNFDGFISRSFTEGEGGEWVDVVYWRDMNSAKKAMETAQGMQSSELGAFFSDIDESSIQMRHTAIIHPGR